MEKSRPTEGPVAVFDDPWLTGPFPTDPPTMIDPPPIEVGANETWPLACCELVEVPPDICFTKVFCYNKL